MIVSRRFVDDVTYRVIGAAITVRKQHGAGLLESVYQQCMDAEMRHLAIFFEKELSVRIVHRSKSIAAPLRCDFLVEKVLVVEVKAVNEFTPVFDAQLYTYMRLLQVPKGLYLNFNCLNMVNDGQHTLVNEIYRSLPEG